VTEALLDERLSRLTLEEKVRLLTGASFWALHPEPKAGLRRLVVSDGPAGVRGETWDERDSSANVPSPTALAASWDEAAVEQVGRLLAAEARRKGVDVLLAPTVNLHRTPYGGRHFECLSEDPLLTGRLGAAYVRGLQSLGVGATVKHFVANDTETERFTYDATVDERTLRELYLAPFEEIVRDGGVWAVMAAYNGVNGHTMTESPMLREILHEEWGFDGVTMTDWYAGRSLAAASAGLDLLMPGPSGPWGDELVAAVKAGTVDETVVDDKVRRILRLAARVGALDGVAAPASPAPLSGAEVSTRLRAAATAGFVLVRNESATLPLDTGALRRVAVLGPNASTARTLGGGSATVFPPHTVSPLDGLRAALGDVEIVHARGGRSTDRLPAAAPGLIRRADGRPGASLTFLAADGSTVATEERDGAAYTWLGAHVAGVPIENVAAVEVRTRLRAPDAGTYLVGGSGLGRFRLTVDGATVLDERLTLPPGADPVEGLMRPPQTSAGVPLAAGQEVELVLRHEPSSSAGFGDSAVHMLVFQLNVERAGDDEAEIAEAVALAAESDVAVVVVGTTEEVESEGFDRATLALPGRQDELVRRVAAANPRTVVVVNAGAPVLLPWADEVPAVLLTWFPGQEFGAALADVLTGAAEPGGRLPVTWPATEDGLPDATPTDGRLRYDEGILIGYRWYEHEGRAPRFPFGHGLGYTGWEFVAIEPADGGVTVRVRNTGDRAGREVVQVYASRPDSAVARAPRWLAGWAVVEAGPGEEVTAAVAIAPRAYEHWSVADGGWRTESGTFVLSAGRSSADLPLSLQVLV
jgi:beta-glucosidase